jgi:hypothetical protein
MTIRIDKEDIPRARNLIVACESCGREKGLQVFGEMASLAEILLQAIHEAEKKEEVPDGNLEHHGVGADNGRDKNGSVGSGEDERGKNGARTHAVRQR